MSKISLKHSGGNVVSLNSPTSAPTSADVAFKLPNADGTSGQALVTDASGNLSFASVAGGKILQVVSTYSTSHISTTSTSFVDSGISATITPSSASNKIFIQSTLNIGANTGGTLYFKIYNGSSEITAATNANSGNGDAFNRSINHSSGAQFDNDQIAHNFLYTSNTTSATTIKIYWRCDGGTAYLNRYGYSTSVGGGSCLTLMEVAA